MNIRFKGHDHPAQGVAFTRLLPPPAPGTIVRYDGEEIGTVDSVADDEVVVRLKPGCEEKFQKLLMAPHITDFAKEMLE